MFIQTQKTPNPLTLKFLPGQPVSPGRAFEILTPEAAAGASPLAEKLFGIDGVENMFFGADFISVTKSEAEDWELLKSHILGVMMEYFVTGLPVLCEKVLEKPEEIDLSSIDDECTRQIIELIETRVRPAVAADGGDVVFDRFEDGIVYLHMRGACAGCPDAAMTLKGGIENMLKHFIPEVEAVEAVEL